MNLKQDFTSPAPDNLIAGDFPIIHGKGTIASGAGKLVRGTVLGRITASKKLVKVDKSKSTGEQVVYAVLSADVDATNADVEAPLYLTGPFNSRKLVFGATDTAADHTDSARALSIFFIETVAG